MFLEKLALFLSISLVLFLLAQIKITYFADKFDNENLKKLIKPFSKTNLLLISLILINHIALYTYVYNGHIHNHNWWFYFNQSFSSIAGFLLSTSFIILIANNKILNRKYNFRYRLSIFYNIIALLLFLAFCFKLFGTDNEYKTHILTNNLSFLVSVVLASIILIFGFIFYSRTHNRFITYFANINISIILFKIISIFQYNYMQNIDMSIWSSSVVFYFLIIALLLFLLISFENLRCYFEDYKLAKKILFIIIGAIIINFIICGISKNKIEKNIVFGEKIISDIDFNGITRAEGEGYFGTRAEFVNNHKFSYHIKNYNMEHGRVEEKPAHFEGLIRDYKITIDKVSIRDDYIVTIYEKSFFGLLKLLMNLLFLYMSFIFLACFVKSKKIVSE